MRPLSEQDPVGDMERIYRFFPPIFASTWGYVPLTESELQQGLSMSAQMFGPGTVMAERGGEVVGASTLVPDFLQPIRKGIMGGRSTGPASCSWR